ncbi:hypothetical protein U1Q18_003143 [Sarracenia purpurea var. burkii]
MKLISGPNPLKRMISLCFLTPWLPRFSSERIKIFKLSVDLGPVFIVLWFFEVGGANMGFRAMAGLLSVLKPRFEVWSVSILPLVEDEDQGIGLPCVEGLVTAVLLFLPPKDYLGGKLLLFVLADVPAWPTFKCT